MIGLLARFFLSFLTRVIPNQSLTQTSSLAYSPYPMPKVEREAVIFAIKFFLNDIAQIYDKKLVKLYRYCGTQIYLEFIRFFRESASFLSLKHTFGPHELSSKIPRTYLLKCHALTLKCIYPQHYPMACLTRRIHQMFSRISISEATNFLKIRPP